MAEWQPIETAPRDEKGEIKCPILVWADRFAFPDIAWWHGGIIQEKCTHWMPLPEPPSVVEEVER